MTVNLTNFDNQFRSLGKERDLADAQYIYDIFCAHINYVKEMDKQGVKYSLATVNVVDRNAFHKIWEEVRIPKDRISHNKPVEFPWSKNARELYIKGGDLSRKFHLEHILELKTIKNEAIRRMMLGSSEKDTIKDGGDMLDYLNGLNRETAFLILTSEEHKKLSKGDESKVENPWAYYEKNGIYKKDCISLKEAGLV